MFSAILSILNYKILLSKCDISQEHAGLLKGLEKLIDKYTVEIFKLGTKYGSHASS